MKAAIRIQDDVRNVLEQAVIEGSILRLPPDLARDLYTRTNKALEALGGKWNRSKGAHVFPGDPREAIAAASQDGKVAHPNQHDFFPTSREVAEIACHRLAAARGHRVLEPSVGEGDLLAPLLDRIGKPRPGDLVLFEKDPRRFPALARKGLSVEHGYLVPCDFLEQAPPTEILFDRILMNPPFERGSDAKHIAHALGFLAPGGRLVSIASAALMTRADKTTKAMKARIAAWGNQFSVTDLPDGSFKHAGTSVATVMLTVDRPAS